MGFMPSMRVLRAAALPIWLALLAPACGSLPKGEPGPLLVRCKELSSQKEYKKAERHFRAVRQRHPQADEAEEATFYLAESRRQLKRSQTAFETFRTFAETYPHSRFGVGAAQGEYRLGVDHFEGRMPGFLFLPADRSYGVRVLEHMQVHYRNHSLADDALGQVAQWHMYKEAYGEGADTLRRLLAEYPRSEHVLWARFHLARARWLQQQGALYDERLLDQARRAFEDYIGTARQLGQAEAQAEQIAEAQEMIRRIDDRRAEKEYLIGRFYERTESPRSAIYYYEHCIKSFPDSPFAAESRKRLQRLRPGAAAPEEGTG